MRRCHGVAYRCGRQDVLELDTFLAESHPTRCGFGERDRFKRIVSVCFRADGRGVNRWLVESGNAVDWERFSKGAYAEARKGGRSRRAGIWKGRFQLPCTARAQRMKGEPSCYVAGRWRWPR